MRYMVCISKKFSDTTIHYHVVDHQLGLQMELDLFLKKLLGPLARLVRSRSRRLLQDMKDQSIHNPPPVQNV